MIRAVIFDLDGVLATTDVYHEQAWRETCEQWGLPWFEDFREKLKGVGRQDCATMIFQQANVSFSEDDVERFADEKNNRYVALLDDMQETDIVPGVVGLLKKLKQKYRLAVASSSKNAGIILEKTYLASYFEMILDGTMLERSKPDPEIFLKAVTMLGLSPEECLVVEDAVAGVEAALSIGCPVAGVGSAASVQGVTYPLAVTKELEKILLTPLDVRFLVPASASPCPKNVIRHGNFRITALLPQLFRIEQDQFTDMPSQAIWYRDFGEVPYSSEVTGDVIEIRTSAVTLRVNTKHFSESSVEFLDGTVAPLDNRDNLLSTCRTLDTNGSHLREIPSVTQYDRKHIPLEPGVCSQNGVAIYDDSKTLLLADDGTFIRRKESYDGYVFAFGHHYQDSVRALYRLCGDTPIITRWALGNWWSRYWPYTQQEYTNLMDNFSDDGIPISIAVIDMDWHHVDIKNTFPEDSHLFEDEAFGGTDGWTGYTWNTALFSDHKALLHDLHQRGMRVTLNLHPALGVRWYEKPYSAMAKSMGMDPESKLRVPFRIENHNFVNHYFDLLHHPLEEEGIDFWWVDWQQQDYTSQPGLSPLWALNHYHYLDNAKRKGAGLILSRYAGFGSHRYPVGFSGDIHMDWEFLDYMPFFTATAANVGYGWWSHDIGGHHRGIRDEELYLRWLQFGVFSPINRIHCCPAEVTSKEPWTLSAPMRAVATKWYQLRHKLVPYLYSASVKNKEEGIPLIRPMYHVYPEERAAYEADHQYFFGDLIVAPITEKSKERGIAEKQVWLPEGRWTDIFSGAVYRGGRWITIWRDAGSMPVFAPEGMVLALDAQVSNSCSKPVSLELYVYEGGGYHELHEEDQTIVLESMMVREGWQVLRILSQNDDRAFRVYFPNIKEGHCSLVVDGKPEEVTLRHNRCLQAFFSLSTGQTAVLTAIWQPETADVRAKEGLLERFVQAPFDNWEKEKLWEECKGANTIEDMLNWVKSLPINTMEKDVLKEPLLAE
jgi:beta-phosphoglucomutase